MTVVTQNTGSTHYFKGFQDSFLLSTKKSIVIAYEEEDRGFSGCCNSNIVTAYPTDSADLDKNDKSQALFRLSTTSDTIVQELWQNGAKVADLNASTWGRYWALGDITDYEGQELLAGYEINWLLVYNAFGIGNFQIKTTITPLSGSVVNSVSSMYKLILFTSEAVNGTIRIESTMNGLLNKTGVIYQGINLKDVLRVPGIISEGDEIWEQVTDRYEATKKEVSRRKGKINVYNMQTIPLYKCTAIRLTDYHAFADEIYISDYNIGNYSYEILRKLVIKEDAFEGADTADNQNRKQSVKGVWKEKTQDNLKIVNF